MGPDFSYGVFLCLSQVDLRPRILIHCSRPYLGGQFTVPITPLLFLFVTSSLFSRRFERERYFPLSSLRSSNSMATSDGDEKVDADVYEQPTPSSGDSQDSTKRQPSACCERLTFTSFQLLLFCIFSLSLTAVTLAMHAWRDWKRVCT
jgi:hypothetical protein